MWIEESRLWRNLSNVHVYQSHRKQDLWNRAGQHGTRILRCYLNHGIQSKANQLYKRN